MSKVMLGWTDVRAKKPVEETIFLFAPAIGNELAHKMSLCSVDLKERFDAIMNLQLIHAGDLNFRYVPGQTNNLWWKNTACNSPVIFKSLWRDEELENWGISSYFFCRRCGINMGSRLTEQELSQLMLHLLIKNAMPEINSCNVINGSYQEWLVAFSRDDRDLFKIGNPKPSHCGTISSGYFRPGLVPSHHPDYCNALSEKPEWIRLLFGKYVEHTNDFLGKIPRIIGGPRRK